MDLAATVEIYENFVKKAKCEQTIRPNLQGWWESYSRQRQIGAA